MARTIIKLLLTLGFISLSLSDDLSKATMKELCNMPEFQQAMANDAELEPAAVVYEVMSKRMTALESKVEELEKRLEGTPTQHDIEAVAQALKLELLDHVDERMGTLAQELEKNVHVILKNLMSNLASLGYEYGFELQTHPTTTTTESPIKDCEYLASQDYKTGVHALEYMDQTIEGYCEMRTEEEDSAWLVIQRRVDGLESFFKGWEDYKEGFGDLMGSFYFGNEKIHMITNTAPHTLRIEITDALGDIGYAEYSNFSLSAEADGYRLSYNAFIAGKIGDSLAKSQGKPFSTFDNDQDGSHLYSCARLHRGGFWYDRCGSANLNGVYSKYSGPATFNWQNIFWYTWKRDLRSLSSVQMMIRVADMLNP